MEATESDFARSETSVKPCETYVKPMWNRETLTRVHPELRLDATCATAQAWAWRIESWGPGSPGKAPENWHLVSFCIVLWLCPHFGTPFSVHFTFFHLFAFVVLKRDEAWWSVMKRDEAWWSVNEAWWNVMKCYYKKYFSHHQEEEVEFSQVFSQRSPEFKTVKTPPESNAGESTAQWKQQQQRKQRKHARPVLWHVWLCHAQNLLHWIHSSSWRQWYWRWYWKREGVTWVTTDSLS